MRFKPVARLELPSAARKYDRWDVDVNVGRGRGEGAYVALAREDAVALRDALTLAIERLR